MRILNYGLVGVVSAVLLSPVAQADTFRCEGQIIEQNMSQEQVLEYCGQPDETSNQERISWIYKRNEGSQNIVVYFYNNGDVEQIETESEQ